MCSQCYLKDYHARNAEKRNAMKRKDPGEYANNFRRPPHKPARIPECGHPGRKHAAHGLCGPCYVKTAKPAICHPGKREVAQGLCTACYSRKRYQLDPEQAQKLARESGRRGREQLRAELLAAYGGKCACPRCPESDPAFLTLEHVGGGGNEHRRKVGSHVYRDLKRRGWPQDGYTLLCWNCNAGSRFTGVCPHMITKESC